VSLLDLTVLVVDPDGTQRVALVEALRRLGLKALGVVIPDEAMSLLDGIDADVAVVRGGGPSMERAAAVLRRRTPVVLVAPIASVEQTVVALLRALGRPDEAAEIN
jgi:hypothetical protein